MPLPPPVPVCRALLAWAVAAANLMVGAPAFAADVAAHQVERAQVLRHIGEIETTQAVSEAADDQRNAVDVDRIVDTALANDRLWRNLLGAQRAELHQHDPVVAGSRVRNAHTLRQQQADDVHRLIERDAAQYRIQLRR